MKSAKYIVHLGFYADILIIDTKIMIKPTNIDFNKKAKF